MKLKTVEYTLPAYWASALINGDYSGCTDEEEKEINAFLDGHPELGGALDCSEAEFSHYNDWDSLGGDVCTFVFPVAY